LKCGETLNVQNVSDLIFNYYFWWFCYLHIDKWLQFLWCFLYIEYEFWYKNEYITIYNIIKHMLKMLSWIRKKQTKQNKK